MDNLVLYLVKSAALMGLFLGAYHVFLKRETFFKSNRWYLLLGLVTAIILPLVTFKKVVIVETAPALAQDPAILAEAVTGYEPDYSAIAYAPASDPSLEINWVYIIIALYAAVALVLTIQFARDFFSLRNLLKGKSYQLRSGYKFVDVPENVAPFSYFNFIVYNSAMFSHDELINVLEHEKVHSIQKHTLDVLFSRIICILFWWNPVVWLYKKAIIQNLEFIADSEAAKRIPDIKAYQFTLLKITTHETCVSITNHFFQSLIKKRIVMLNKNQSSKWNSYKYLLIVPALAAFMVYFQVKVIAQEKQADAFIFNGAQRGVEIVVNKNTTDAQLKEHAENLKKDHGIKLKFSKVKRNASGEIVSIKAEFKDNNGKKGTTMITGDKAIEPIRFYKNGNNVGFGSVGRSRWVNNMNFNHNGMNRHMTAGDEEEIEIAEPFELDTDSAGSHIVIRSVKNGKQKIIVDGKVVSESGTGEDETDEEAEDIEVRTYANGTDGGMIFINGEKIFGPDDVAKWTEFGLESAQNALAEVDMGEIREEVRLAMADARRSQADLRRNHAEMRRKNMTSNHDRESQRQELEQMKAELAQTKAEMARTKAEMNKIVSDLKKEKAAADKKRKK